MLLLGVDDPDRAGNLGHIANTAECALELVLLTTHHEEFLLRLPAAGDIVEVDLFQLLQALQALVNGIEVSEHAAEPTLIDVRHADTIRLLGNRFLSLLLGADEHDGSTVGDGFLHVLVGTIDVRQRLLKIDDVDAVALGKDEALHLGVPAPGLVPKVDTTLQKLAHRDDGHGRSPSSGARARRRWHATACGCRSTRRANPWRSPSTRPPKRDRRADGLREAQR